VTLYRTRTMGLLRSLTWMAISSSVGAWLPTQHLTGTSTRVVSHTARSAIPRAEVPLRSDDEFDYFRRQKRISVTLEKPLGAVLEESAAGGVQVEDLQDGGSAAETGLLRKGDRLISVLGKDVSMSDFDSVMTLLVEAPAAVELDVERNVIVKRKREVMPDPKLSVKGGPSGDIAYGSNLRLSLQSAGVQLYKGMDKLTNCGGAGQCNTCLVNILEGAENLSPRTAAEEKRLAKKPPTYRMACQALINGDVTVEALPE